MVPLLTEGLVCSPRPWGSLLSCHTRSDTVDATGVPQHQTVSGQTLDILGQAPGLEADASTLGIRFGATCDPEPELEPEGHVPPGRGRCLLEEGPRGDAATKMLFPPEGEAQPCDAGLLRHQVNCSVPLPGLRRCHGRIFSSNVIIYGRSSAQYVTACSQELTQPGPNPVTCEKIAALDLKGWSGFSRAFAGLSRLPALGLPFPDHSRAQPRSFVAMWLMLQSDEPEDFVIATGEVHSVREFVEKSFLHIGKTIVWEGKDENEVGRCKETGKVHVTVDLKYYRPTEVQRLSPGCSTLLLKDTVNAVLLPL
ncbi:hypothetical protein CB1_000218004 [Camelus ferus]|nr:hypothetical protein CB1_000218004 [Camelus ferus]